MATADVGTVQQRAAALEKELAAVRQLESAVAAIRSLKQSHPDLIETFKHELRKVIDEVPVATELFEGGASASPATGFERLTEWFRERNNLASTVEEMAAAIGLSRMTIKSFLYRTRKDHFRIDRRDKNNRTYYKMANL